MKDPIYISSIASVSALGERPESIHNAYLSSESAIKWKTINGSEEPVASIPDEIKIKIQKMATDSGYNKLDPTVLFAIYAARSAKENAAWDDKTEFGINLGSSRGATTLTEIYHKEYLNKNSVSVLSSPTTTLGNISSWVAQDLGSDGPVLSHSITCSTALHALINGVAWIKAGMTDRFLVGGSEAPLTPFTVSQMKALNIYSSYRDEFPCKALDLQKTSNSMVLGEGAAVFTLEKSPVKKPLVKVAGIGYGTEKLDHPASISADANCFQKSMKMALDQSDLKIVDAIVTHAPGTILGDNAEIQAIKTIFGDAVPALTNNKWALGHTLGTSGALSIEMAILMIRNKCFYKVPYLSTQAPHDINSVMVNAVGFGGNAVSVILQNP